mmetsp:Transcript_45204/g.89588  ORF Transcript_45204/g.89588 Transcript_45204/m.89588 type:complete len:89 (+) Transcript_45204:358-624(+)
MSGWRTKFEATTTGQAKSNQLIKVLSGSNIRALLMCRNNNRATQPITTVTGREHNAMIALHCGMVDLPKSQSSMKKVRTGVTMSPTNK